MANNANEVTAEVITNEPAEDNETAAQKVERLLKEYETLKDAVERANAIETERQAIETAIAAEELATRVAELKDNPCGCVACMFHHTDTAKEFNAGVKVTATGGTGRNVKITGTDRPVFALVTCELRSKGKTQTDIGKVLLAAYPDIYPTIEDGAKTAPDTMMGSVAGAVLRGAGDWNSTTGFDGTVRTYKDRTMAELQAAVANIRANADADTIGVAENIIATA